MLRTATAKIARVGRVVSTVFGLALVMALVFGIASMAVIVGRGAFRPLDGLTAEPKTGVRRGISRASLGTSNLRPAVAAASAAC